MTSVKVAIHSTPCMAAGYTLLGLLEIISSTKM